jgi:L-histidine N-alpha-methyltransferase
MPTAFTLERFLTPDDRAAALVADIRAGLTAVPKSLPPKWFYDQEGGRLFDQLTRTPEYYPTRCERSILSVRAADIARRSAADTLVELGSGTSEKTRILLTALADAGTLRRFVPFDVDEEVLAGAGRRIGVDYPGIAVHAIVGDFERHLALLPAGERRLIAFLGGTIGNFYPADRARFLATLRRIMHAGDTLVLGTDLVKDPARIVPAYDDSAGIGIRFNRNILTVVNRAVAGDLKPEAFDHVARWDPVNEWIEVLLRSRRYQVAHLRAIELTVSFDAGEELRTEISAKFRPAGVAAELAAAGLRPLAYWTDPRGDFGVSMAVSSPDELG